MYFSLLGEIMKFSYQPKQGVAQVLIELQKWLLIQSFNMYN